MVQRLFEAEKRRGCHRVVSPANSELKFLTLERIVLAEGDEYEEDSGTDEAVLSILSGKCSIEVSDSLMWQGLGWRPNAFEGKATVVYVPMHTTYSIVAENHVDILKVKAPAAEAKEAFLVKPGDLVARSSGSLNWRRDVCLLVDQESPSSRLIVGETVNPPGCWSGYPPHKHDVDNPPVEAKLEEVYFFMAQPADGFGLMRLYTDPSLPDALDEAYVVRSECAVVIPRGYHPVVAAPGYRLFFFWALAGERKLFRSSEDPRHGWVRNVEPMINLLRV